jgi:type I restriction enzyme R subunit
MVVVDKLLTGFDEPCNAVLYVDKPLKEHTLLQAIARVNRLAEGKDYGYIIDYRGCWANSTKR